MKLIRFGEPGKERPGLLLSDGTRIDTSGFRPNGVFAYDEEFFASDGLAQLRQWIASHVKAAPGVAPRSAEQSAERSAEQDRVHRSQLATTRPKAGWELPKEPSSFLSQQRLWSAPMIPW
jgi:2,4-didehydro-3-deoxy-L-rhamnonate hydrolase